MPLINRSIHIFSEQEKFKVVIWRGGNRKEYAPKFYSRNRLERFLGAIGPVSIAFGVDSPRLIYRKDKYLARKQPALF